MIRASMLMFLVACGDKEDADTSAEEECTCECPEESAEEEDSGSEPEDTSAPEEE